MLVFPVLVNPKELSLHTLHLHQSTLVRMLNVAVKEGMMDKNPFYALGRQTTGRKGISHERGTSCAY